jgi:histidine triad (HIT) family protein
MPDNCLFCKIIRGDIPSTKIYEDEEMLAFRDIAPQAPVHFLLVPKKHISGPSGVTPADEQLIGRMIRKAGEIAGKEGVPHYRLVFNNGEGAGQSVFHIHLHVLGGRDMNWPPG